MIFLNLKKHYPMRKYLLTAISAALFLFAGCKPEPGTDSVDPTLGVDKRELSFNFEGSPVVEGGDTFQITSNTDWEITPAETWFELSATSGNEGATITVEVEANTTDEAREVELTVTTADGAKSDKIVLKQESGAVAKESKILAFAITGTDIVGTIDQEAKTIVLSYWGDIDDMEATFELSTNATIDPNPADPRSYTTPQEFTVTSGDKSSTTTYTVSKVTPPGINPASFTQEPLWVKTFDELGVDLDFNSGGIAVTDMYVVLNTRAKASTYMDRVTGDKLGTIDLGVDYTGSVRNFYNTADADGNILISNLTTNDGNVLKIFKLTDIDSDVKRTPESFIEWDAAGRPIGRKVSINGSIDGDAIITAPFHDALNQFARWQVIDGELVSQTPSIVTMTGPFYACDVTLTKEIEIPITANAVDVISMSSTDATGDYLHISKNAINNNLDIYQKASWFNGSTNTVLNSLPHFRLNDVVGSVDFVEFNGAKYALFSIVGPTWFGTAEPSDVPVLVNASSAETFNAGGTYGDNELPKVGQAILWLPETGLYGVAANPNPVQNTNGTGDVAFKVDGQYLYVYYMCSNGTVACWRFDSI
jgi:hypothetical protein